MTFNKASLIDHAVSSVRVIVTLSLLAAFIFGAEELATRTADLTKMVVTFWFAERMLTKAHGRASQNGNS